MEGIVDIHNHILCGLDDGAETLQDSMEMIREAYNQGVRAMICTPHYYPGMYEADAQTVKSIYERIKKEAGNKYPEMEFYLGNEILCTGEVVELLKQNKVYSLANSKYVLIEFFVEIEYEVLENKVKEILLNGYIPIIAHCERYQCLRERISRVARLVESGAYIQVNAKSVYAFRNRKFVEKLIDGDCLHFVASDAHDVDKRGIYLKKSISYLERKYSDEYVRWLFVENPQKVIENKYI